MPKNNSEMKERRATYTALSGIFLSIFAAVAARHSDELKVRPFDLVMLGFSTYRLGRLVAYDKVFETFRSPVTRTVDDPSGAGQTVVPKGRGIQRALGELMACPICAGTWISAALTYALTLAPRPTRVFLTMMSAIGISEFLNAATEALKWAGQVERMEVGEYQRGA